MLHFFRLRISSCVLVAAVFAAQPWVACAQTAPDTVPAPLRPALTAELFYEMLLGELASSHGDPGTGYTLMLQAARQSNDAKLYHRAVEIALQARSGDSALIAAQAWHNAQPQSREATRQLLQILVALNRIEETGPLLQATLEQTPEATRQAALQSIPALYARTSHKALAATLVEQALQGWLNDPTYGPVAWASIGRMRVAADDKKGALEAALRAHEKDPTSEATVLLALELIQEGVPSAQSLLEKYFTAKAPPEMRTIYARLLLAQQRYPEAAEQLHILTREQPDRAEPWLLQATLQTQDNQLAAAEQSLAHYDTLLQAPHSAILHKGGTTQALLLHAQIAEKRGQFDIAEAWLLQIEDSQALVGVQLRRASLLVRQGRVTHARALIQTLPATNREEELAKLSAETQVLRQARLYQQAYELQGKVTALAPEDNDQLYDHAMLAEKAGHFDVMEQLLRRLIARQPDYHHALNALGYWLADRGERLPEAKSLIERALSHAPGDPFITDSLGWVEFRLGHLAQALTLLEQAYAKRPDPEIAAHLGEVLWTLQQHDKAREVWATGLRQAPDNETLVRTLQRLKVQP